jgi:hypothetical protein
MKKIFGTALVLILSISLIFGASPALAQTKSNEKEVPVSLQLSSDNQTPEQVFAIDNALMEEFDRLVRMIEEAEHRDDQELAEALQEKIQVIKEEIGHASEKPTAVEEPLETQVVFQPPTVVGSSEGIVVNPSNIDPCVEMKALEEKKQYYEALYALSDEELEGKGYHRGKEELRITIENLKKSIERARIECEGGVPSSGGGGGSTPISPTETVPVEYIPPRPIAVESGGEITDYYKRRIAEIAIEEAEIEKQIASLKELRNEIDRLIEELIKSKSEISAEEVSGLVTKIEVRPGEVKMDKVVVKTVDKSVVARIDNRELAIKPTRAQVIIRDENLEIKAPELSIENEVLRVGDSEVKLRPGAIIEEIKIEPKEIELKEENAKAVYKIKADENRKLLGFIPMKVEKILTVDAASTETNIIKEEKPWWAFLTTK